MISTSGINEYIQSLKNSERMGHQVVYHRILPGHPPVWSETKDPLHPGTERILRRIHIHKLFRHQAEAMDLLRRRDHVVVATPTASGKTLIYNLPVFEKFFNNPRTTALYIFPLKALAQDQLKTFCHWSSIEPLLKKWHPIVTGRRPLRPSMTETPPGIEDGRFEKIHRMSSLPTRR